MLMCMLNIISCSGLDKNMDSSTSEVHPSLILAELNPETRIDIEENALKIAPETPPVFVKSSLLDHYNKWYGLGYSYALKKGSIEYGYSIKSPTNKTQACRLGWAMGNRKGFVEKTSRDLFTNPVIK